MDRLEEIRKKDWQLNNHAFPIHSNKQLCKRDIVWLISEIERVRKEAEAAIETLKGENEKLAFENDRLRKEKDDLVLANKGRKALSEAQFSCMEKLEKEKEWLINGWAKLRSVVSPRQYPTEYEKESILKEMQQALKEEE